MSQSIQPLAVTMFLVEILRSMFGSSSNDEYTRLGDSAAILEAVAERTDGSVDFQIELGMPELIDRGNTTQDLWVTIPTSTENGPDPADLEFDLPAGAEDQTADLFKVMDFVGIEGIESLHEMVGETVPAMMENGVPVPAFDFSE